MKMCICMGQISLMISKYLFVIDRLTLVPFNMSLVAHLFKNIVLLRFIVFFQYLFSQLFLLKYFLYKLC